MTGKNKTRIFVYSVILLMAAAVVWKYYPRTDELMYITQPVKKQTVRQVVNATGEIKAIELVTVGAQASGKIEKLFVQVGDKVKKGDMIAQIDSTTQQNQVDTNTARLESYNAQLTAANVSLDIAQKQLSRMLLLRQKDATSEEELENAENAYEAAKSHMTELKALVKEAEIARNTAETNLGYTKITAPLDGTVVSVPVKIGQTVNAAMNTPTIVQIADLSQMEILVEISEGDIAHITPGLKVSYSILTDLKNTYETTVKSIDPGLTLLTNGSYAEVVGNSEAIYYYARLVVPNEDGKLRIGMTTQNVIYVAEAIDVLSIPTMAVKGDEANQYVEVLKPGNQVERRTVTTGVSDGLHVEIKSGLTGNEEVIIAQMTSSEASDKINNSPMRRRF